MRGLLSCGLTGICRVTWCCLTKKLKQTASNVIMYILNINKQL